MFKWLFGTEDRADETTDLDEDICDTATAFRLLKAGQPDRSEETAEQLDTPDLLDIDVSKYRFGKR